MKRTFLSLTLLLLISVPALGVAEPAVPQNAAPLVTPASPPPQSSAPNDQAANELPAPLADVIWLSCTQAQNQYCYDTYCAPDPDCISCVGFCRGTDLLSCRCEY